MVSVGTCATPSRCPWISGDVCHAIEMSVIVWGHATLSRCPWSYGDTCHAVRCPWLYGDTCHVVVCAWFIGWTCTMPSRWPWSYGDTCHAVGCPWFMGWTCVTPTGVRGHTGDMHVRAPLGDTCHADGCAWSHGDTCHTVGGCVVTHDVPSGVRGCTGTRHAVGVSLLTMPCRRGGRATSERHRGRDVTSVSPPKKPRLTFATVTSPNTQ